jgi:predicted acylesterase/phospholipase RssA
MPRLSARKYAQRIGISGSYVSRLVREGKLPIDADGRIDPDEADRILAATREPARSARRALPSSTPASAHPIAAPPPHAAPAAMPVAGGADLPTLLLKARTKSEVEKGKLLELKAKAEAAKFVDADEVKAAAFHKARIVRDALLNIASRLAPLVAAETDERACFDLIDREVRQALEDLAGPA